MAQREFLAAFDHSMRGPLSRQQVCCWCHPPEFAWIMSYPSPLCPVPMPPPLGSVDPGLVPARAAPRQSSSIARCWPTGAHQVDSASERIKLGYRPGRGWHWPLGGGRQRRCGYCRGGCVVAAIWCFFAGVGFVFRKPLPQIQRSTLFLLQEASHTRPFGGLGFRNRELAVD